jgi:dCMP deaminase
MIIELPDEPTWDEYFVAMARLASARSKDPSTKIGAVIVGPDNESVSTGYNSLPRNCKDDVPERFERPEKYKWFEHAERNAVYHAALRGSPTKGCRIFLSCWVPCTDCARALINCGIIEVVLGRETEDPNRVKWIEEGIRSLTMFQEAGVKVRYYEHQTDYSLTMARP